MVENEFAAEGEETVTETIVIDNETVAQDEENQKITEELQNNETSEKIVTDEVM